jgi:hypothetical protein
LRPIVPAKDVAEDGGGLRRQIAATVFDSYAPQLDLSFAAAVYGLAGLFLGSLMGELLVAALATAALLRRLSAGLAAARYRVEGVQNRCGALRSGLSSSAGPRVRISLPPGESPLRTWTTDDSGVLGQCRWETEPSAVSPGIDHDDIRKSGFEMASLHPGRAV